MPKTIPYDSSLVLGNVVDKNALSKLEAAVAKQVPADTEKAQLNNMLQAYEV